MAALKTFINQNLFLILFAVLITVLSTTTTYAGFEWIPQKKQAVIDEPEMIQVRPAQQPGTQAIMQLEPLPEDDIVVLPLPINNTSAPPMPVIQAPAPMPIAQAPVSITRAPAPITVIAPPPHAQPPMSFRSPTRIAVMPGETPNSGAIAPHTIDKLPPLPEPIIISEPEQREMYRKKLVMPPSVDRNNMRIIVPDDAPQSAMDQVKQDTVYIPNRPSAGGVVYTHPASMPFVNAQTPVANVIPPTQHNSIFTEAVGFAKDVPLALALRQVVPPEYAFSFESGINPGIRVSWNGGKPWNEVVADMVTPLGYAVRISHKKVVISLEKAASASSSEAAFFPPALIEPAAGTEEEIRDELPAELAIIDSPSKPINTDVVISSKDAPLPTVTNVQRKREIKRVNITDPGALSNVSAKEPQTKIAPIQLASVSAPVTQTRTGLLSSLANDFPQDKAAKISFWTAEKGASLKDTLIAWSDSANTDLVWNATYDFQLPSDFEARGSFEKAVDLLLKHGVSKDANLGHSYSANSNNDRIQIIVDEKA